MGCLKCGKELIQTLGKRTKIFCSISCRSGYYQQQKKRESGIPLKKPGRPKKNAGVEKVLLPHKSLQSENLERQIAENNKPENKARILKERHTVAAIKGENTPGRDDISYEEFHENITGQYNDPVTPARSFRDYMALLKTGNYDALEIKAAVKASKILTNPQKSTLYANIK